MLMPEQIPFRIDLARPSAAREFNTLFRLYCGRLKPDPCSSSFAFSSALDRLATLLPLHSEQFNARAFRDAITDFIGAHNGRHERTIPDHAPIVLGSSWLHGEIENWHFRTSDFGDLTLTIIAGLQVVYFKFHHTTDHGRRLLEKLWRLYDVNHPIPALNASFVKSEPFTHDRTLLT